MTTKETDREQQPSFPSTLTQVTVLRERLLVIINPRREVRVRVRVEVSSPTQSKESKVGGGKMSSVTNPDTGK